MVAIALRRRTGVRRPVIELAFHTRKCPRCGAGGECRGSGSALPPAYGWAWWRAKTSPSWRSAIGNCTMRTGCARGTNSSAGRLRDRGGARRCRRDRLPCAPPLRHQGPARQAGRCQARRGLRAADRDRRAGRARPRRSGLPVPLRLRQHCRGAGRRAACGKDALVRVCVETEALPGPPPAIHPGERYGRLVVLGEAERPAARGARAYVCDCVCGQETTVRGSNLRRGHTRSSGCLCRTIGEAAVAGTQTPAVARDSLRSGRPPG